MVDKKALFFARMELYKFLQKHPQYISFQKELEVKLDKVETPEERLIILNRYMRQNLERIKKEFEKINSLVSEVKENMEKKGNG